MTFVRGYRTVTPWTPRNTCVYTRQPAQWHVTDDVLTRLPAKTHKNRNACLDALQLPFKQKIWVYTASGANYFPLISFIYPYHILNSFLCFTSQIHVVWEPTLLLVCSLASLVSLACFSQQRGLHHVSSVLLMQQHKQKGLHPQMNAYVSVTSWLLLVCIHQSCLSIKQHRLTNWVNPVNYMYVSQILGFYLGGY